MRIHYVTYIFSNEIEDVDNLFGNGVFLMITINQPLWSMWSAHAFVHLLKVS